MANSFQASHVNTILNKLIDHYKPNRPTALLLGFAIATTLLLACSDDKTASKPNESPKKELVKNPKTKKTADKSSAQKGKEDGNKKSGIVLLDQLHKDTVLRQVRLPRYDENFNPLSQLNAERMQVIDGNTIEAHDVSMDLYDRDGSVKANTKVRQAIYTEENAILRAQEAIYISGVNFKISGTGMVYEINTGQGFITGPASSLFLIDR